MTKKSGKKVAALNAETRRLEPLSVQKYADPERTPRPEAKPESKQHAMHTNAHGAMRVDTGLLTLPEGLAPEKDGKSAARSNRVMIVVAVLVLIFIVFIAWMIAISPDPPPKP